MVICKFFLQGNCRYGANCRNEHPRSGGRGFASENRFGALQSPGDRRRDDGGKPGWSISVTEVKHDLTSGKGRPNWILSTYGPGRGAPASLLEGNEYSPEELRVRFYELASNGNQNQANEEATALWSKAERGMAEIVENANQTESFMEEAEKKHPNRYDYCKTDGTRTREEIAKAAESSSAFGVPSGMASGTPFDQQPTSNSPFSKTSPFGSAGGSGLGGGGFGIPAQPSQFGQSTAAFGKPSFGTPGFGGQPTPGFGQPSQSTPAFGQPSQPGPVFGQPAQPSAFGGSPFGGSAQAASPFGQTSQSMPAFGQPSQPGSGFGQPSQLTSPFSQPSQANPSFGQPSQPAPGFGQPTQASPFSQSTQPPSFGASPFGAKSESPFSQTTGASNASPFGQPPTSSPFGGSASLNTFEVKPESLPFGKPAQPESSFGQPAQSASPFGQPAQSASPFGQPAQSASPFGQPAQALSSFGQPSQITSPFGQSTQEPAAASPFGKQPTQSSATPAAPVTSTSLPNTNTSTTPHPLTSKPPHPLHYTQTLPSAPVQINSATQRLASYKSRPVQYVDGAPCYSRPDTGQPERIWFPQGGGGAEIVTLAKPEKLGDLQAPDASYTNDVLKAYTYLFEHGRFEAGKMPSVPPKREWCVYDF